jgi:PEP-CTERM motif
VFIFSSEQWHRNCTILSENLYKTRVGQDHKLGKRIVGGDLLRIIKFLRASTMLSLTVALVLFATSATEARADLVTYVTPAGSTTSGGAVDASATFVTGTDSLTITLTNLYANPTDVAQLISDLDFTLSNGATSGTLQSSSGQQITVNGDGSYTLGSTGSTGWGLNQNVSGGLQLDALGFIGPSGLIIGPPDGSNLYSNANGSIAGNGPHNPFLDQTATFVLNIDGVTADTTVSSATFSFGTTAGIDVQGTPNQVPEPSSLIFLGTGLAGFAGLVRRKLNR